MFLQASVILFTGGCLPQCMLGYHTPGKQTPPSRADPPKSRHPPEQTPPQDQVHPQSRHPPIPGTTPQEADAESGIRSMSGRYTSYWNALLLIFIYFNECNKISNWDNGNFIKNMSFIHYFFVTLTSGGSKISGARDAPPLSSGSKLFHLMQFSAKRLQINSLTHLSGVDSPPQEILDPPLLTPTIVPKNIT